MIILNVLSIDNISIVETISCIFLIVHLDLFLCIDTTSIIYLNPLTIVNVLSIDNISIVQTISCIILVVFLD